MYEDDIFIPVAPLYDDSLLKPLLYAFPTNNEC